MTFRQLSLSTKSSIRLVDDNPELFCDRDGEWVSGATVAAIGGATLVAVYMDTGCCVEMIVLGCGWLFATSFSATSWGNLIVCDLAGLGLLFDVNWFCTFDGVLKVFCILVTGEEVDFWLWVVVPINALERKSRSSELRLVGLLSGINSKLNYCLADVADCDWTPPKLLKCSTAWFLFGLLSNTFSKPPLLPKLSNLS
jgi:hypothetical protein